MAVDSPRTQGVEDLRPPGGAGCRVGAVGHRMQPGGARRPPTPPRGTSSGGSSRRCPTCPCPTRRYVPTSTRATWPWSGRHGRAQRLAAVTARGRPSWSRSRSVSRAWSSLSSPPAAGPRARVDAHRRQPGPDRRPGHRPEPSPGRCPPPGPVSMPPSARSRPQVRLLVADVTDGSCRPVHSIDPDTAAPIGSVLKLYVLARAGHRRGRGHGRAGTSR